MKAVVFFTTTHLVIGSLMLVSSLALTLWVYRFSAFPRAARSKEILKEQYSV
jgi:hypothetical protein